jgi:hypothetical protein
MRRDSRLPWLTCCALALSLGTLACSGTYRSCIRLRTGGGREGIAAEQCDRECKRGHAEGDYEYLRCLAACPGAEISQHDTCGPQDLQPGLVCRVTDMSLDDSSSSPSSADGAGSRVLAGVGWLAMEAIASALTGGSSSSSSSDSDSSESSSSSQSSTARPVSPKPSAHKPAEASKRHAPAKAHKD